MSVAARICTELYSAKVLDMAVKVCVSWAKERLNRWIQSSLTGSHQQSAWACTVGSSGEGYVYYIIIVHTNEFLMYTVLQFALCW